MGDWSNEDTSLADGEGDRDADIVSDGDSSEFTDGDADGDVDGDTDVDGDVDGDGGVQDRGIMGVCLDGVEQDEEGLTDCEDLECLSTTGCCRNLLRQWIDGEFSQCSSLPACSWSTFPSDSSTQDLDGAWVRLSENDGGEVGMYTDAVVEVQGEPVISFVGYLDPASCTEGVCQQSIGLALTRQEIISSGTGIIPSVGLVLDGDAGEIHLIIDGRLEGSLTPESFTSLTEPRGYAIKILRDGTVAFWAGLPLAETEPDPQVAPFEEPHFLSSRSVSQGESNFRVALFGRLMGEGLASVGGVRVERPVCDVPNRFERLSPYAVLEPFESGEGVLRPSVIERPFGQGLVMVYEDGNDLSVATSMDGLEWTRVGLAFAGEAASTNYGRVARRAPSVVYTDPPINGIYYHLWFEAESEYMGIASGDEPKFAILHAVSTDGIYWTEEAAENLFSLIGSEDFTWRYEVTAPTVVAMEENASFTMFYVGHSAELTSVIGWASSIDGILWSAGEQPIAFESEGTLDFERDGIDHPIVVRRGNRLHLWYTGKNGARESIGYAVEVDRGVQPWAWQRYGQVFSASENWESMRVLAPAILTLPSSSDDPLINERSALLYLWYSAGAPGEERIGVAQREIPAGLSD